MSSSCQKTFVRPLTNIIAGEAAGDRYSIEADFGSAVVKMTVFMRGDRFDRGTGYSQGKLQLLNVIRVELAERQLLGVVNHNSLEGSCGRRRRWGWWSRMKMVASGQAG